MSEHEAEPRRRVMKTLLLAGLLLLGVAPAHAYDLPQDYLDALRDLDAPARPAHGCDLFMELQDQSLHIVRKCAGIEDDDGIFHVKSRQSKCTTRLTGIEQTDHVTYLVYFIDSGSDCEGHSQRALQFQLIDGGATLQIINAENS